ncbi:hypothetical protein IWX49DRAFT_581442, partial [Phyllosticta citricarpa]
MMQALAHSLAACLPACLPVTCSATWRVSICAPAADDDMWACFCGCGIVVGGGSSWSVQALAGECRDVHDCARGEYDGA